LYSSRTKRKANKGGNLVKFGYNPAPAHERAQKLSFSFFNFGQGAAANVLLPAILLTVIAVYLSLPKGSHLLCLFYIQKYRSKAVMPIL